ncbi:unnamed protein product [Paramecium octaurelia]|uniref:Uncharacterized protein n=1 Tax=Paramecium octaurelia TaxID=43137 RepID=A0A8S1W1L4_PAROT|nr:unnamed protein product [Paramecium octaurelia]
MEIHQHLVVQISLFVSGMQKHLMKYFNQIVAIKVCLPSLTYHFRIALYCHMLILIVQYLEYVRILYLKHQEHLSYKDNSLIIKGKIQNLCLNQRVVVFQKTQNKGNSEFEYSLKTLQLQFNHFFITFQQYVFFVTLQIFGQY